MTRSADRLHRRVRRGPRRASLRRRRTESPKTTDPWNARSWWLAPTEVTQGTDAGLPTVDGLGPALPAEVATNTPASAANKKAMSSGRSDQGAAPDRVVDHVDAVGNGGVDGICQVTAEAALLATGLVGGDVGPVRDAGDDATVDPEDLRGHPRCPGGACGVSAVTVGSRAEL